MISWISVQTVYPTNQLPDQTMKITITLFIFILSSSAIAQFDGTTMTKQQFLAFYESALTNAGPVSDIQNSAMERMKKTLGEEKFKEIQAEEAKMEKRRAKQVAKCMGVPEEELNDLKAKATPQVMLGLMTQCSDKLPDTIDIATLGSIDSPALSDFNSCFDSAGKKQFGVSTTKYQQCEQKFDESEQDW